MASITSKGSWNSFPEKIKTKTLSYLSEKDLSNLLSVNKKISQSAEKALVSSYENTKNQINERLNGEFYAQRKSKKLKQYFSAFERANHNRENSSNRNDLYSIDQRAKEAQIIYQIYDISVRNPFIYINTKNQQRFEEIITNVPLKRLAPQFYAKKYFAALKIIHSEYTPSTSTENEIPSLDMDNINIEPSDMRKVRYLIEVANKGNLDEIKEFLDRDLPVILFAYLLNISIQKSHFTLSHILLHHEKSDSIVTTYLDTFEIEDIENFLRYTQQKRETKYTEKILEHKKAKDLSNNILYHTLPTAGATGNVKVLSKLFRLLEGKKVDPNFVRSAIDYATLNNNPLALEKLFCFAKEKNVNIDEGNHLYNAGKHGYTKLLEVILQHPCEREEFNDTIETTTTNGHLLATRQLLHAHYLDNGKKRYYTSNLSRENVYTIFSAVIRKGYKGILIEFTSNQPLMKKIGLKDLNIFIDKARKSKHKDLEQILIEAKVRKTSSSKNQNQL